MFEFTISDGIAFVVVAAVLYAIWIWGQRRARGAAEMLESHVAEHFAPMGWEVLRDGRRISQTELPNELLPESHPDIALRPMMVRRASGRIEIGFRYAEHMVANPRYSFASAFLCLEQRRQKDRLWIKKALSALELSSWRIPARPVTEYMPSSCGDAWHILGESADLTLLRKLVSELLKCSRVVEVIADKGSIVCFCAPECFDIERFLGDQREAERVLRLAVL